MATPHDVAIRRHEAHAPPVTAPSGGTQPRQGWLTQLPEDEQRAFQESTVLIEILTGRIRTLGEIGLLDLAVAEPLDGHALAAMLAEHSEQAREQADVFRELSEQFRRLAEIARGAQGA